ncbi:CBS domain-containing protein, partial [Balneolaceae bacterium ANBcel3]|nr:CBS domain-containing protein [Balneolaceae bacterium ANBcel3]
MKVKELLHKKGCDVITVGVDTTVYDAIDLMAKKNIGALVVMCRGDLCGIISERDYRNKIILMGR